MNRTTLLDGLAERYGAAAEYPWAKSPDFAVFRHTGNRKWFCLYMPVPSEKSIAYNNKFPYNASLISGKVDEWLKSHAWKACIRE